MKTPESPPSWIKRRLLAQHLSDTTPPRKSDEEASRKGLWIFLLVWAAAVAAAGFWRGCGP